MHRSTSLTSLTKAWKDGEDKVRNYDKYIVSTNANVFSGARNDCFSFTDRSKRVDLRSEILQTTAKRLIAIEFRILL
jgi:hypothetical protein